MKVVNIMPLELLEVVRTKMISALDWSLQRWNEEGKATGEEVGEVERHFDSDLIIERETRTKRSNDTFEEEEEEEEDKDEEEDEEVEEEDNIIVDLGESEDDGEEEEVEVSEVVEDEVETEAYNEVVEAAMAEAFSLKISKLVMSPEHMFLVALSPMAISPKQVPHGCSPMRVVEMEVEGEEEDVGQHDASKLQEVDLPRPEQGVQFPVASFSSGIPSTPGRGFMQFETSR